MLPATMNAIEITQAGGPEVLKLTTRPVPQPAAGQVLIKVAYAGINRHDCGQRNRGSRSAQQWHRRAQADGELAKSPGAQW